MDSLKYANDLVSGDYDPLTYNTFSSSYRTLSLIIANGKQNIVFSPNLGYFGIAICQYSAKDLFGGISNTATCTVQVYNDKPTSTDKTITTHHSTPVVLMFNRTFRSRQ